MRGHISGSANLRKIDDLTIEVDTHGPYPMVLRELTALLIFDQEWSEHGGDQYLARHVLGTGPFVVERFEPDTQCVLRANPGWWNAPQKTHNLTTVVFTPIRSDATRVAALLSGQVDLIFPVPLQDIDRVRQAPGIRVLERPSLRTLMLGMNLRAPELRGSDVRGRNPLQDPRVRRALHHAVDIDGLVGGIMRGHAEPAGTIVPRSIHGYDARLDGRLPFDPAAARQLLADAGYANGFSLGLDCPNNRYINDEEICVALVGMFAKVGVRAELRTRPHVQHLQAIMAGTPDLFLLGWAAADTMDAHGFIKDLMHTPAGAKGSFNGGGYSNPRLDALEVLIAREADEARRRELIYQAVSLHKEDIGHIPLHTQTSAWAAREDLEALQPPIEALWFRFMRLK
jgi:peptide/nickel transport system substrate-binding protein